MPTWNHILEEIGEKSAVHDSVRRDYLRRLHQKSQRNIILYYSAWLQKPDHATSTLCSINDEDITGLMTCVNQLDKSIGCDLLLHTPGGSITATETIVRYLRQIFGNNIRAIVPQMAMSAGTMISLSCKNILLGRYSS